MVTHRQPQQVDVRRGERLVARPGPGRKAAPLRAGPVRHLEGQRGRLVGTTEQEREGRPPDDAVHPRLTVVRRGPAVNERDNLRYNLIFVTFCCGAALTP